MDSTPQTTDGTVLYTKLGNTIELVNRHIRGSTLEEEFATVRFRDGKIRKVAIADLRADGGENEIREKLAEAPIAIG